MIKLDLTRAGISEKQLSRDCAVMAFDALINGTGDGSEFTGWLRFDADDAELERIEKSAARLREHQAVVVVGIGGSYLGARAVLELLDRGEGIYFAGNGLSQRAMNRLLKKLEGIDFAICVISKSGTTTEPAVAFRILNAELEKRYGREGAAKRIVAITDAKKGAMRELADREGYETFVVPDDIGGRYSVLTPVGLLPLATAGVDIRALLKGMRSERSELLKNHDNDALKYAMARNILYNEGKKVELLCSYEPDFRFMGEWFKQLFGESEGKDGKGIFPAYAEFTADLHSLGQYIQQGERHLFETVVRFDYSRQGIEIPAIEGEGDGLACLTGKTLGFVDEQAFTGTVAAHVEGGVPNLAINAGEINEETVGALIFFFELACGISAYMLGVNPFDQPGVEDYKRNMFALIGKPGYEELCQMLTQNK